MKKILSTKAGRVLFGVWVASAVLLVICLILFKTAPWSAKLVIPLTGAFVGVGLVWLGIDFALEARRKKRERSFDAGIAAKEGIEDRKREWAQWTEELRRQNIDRYELPFYLLVGEPQSGKSVLLQNSDLNFPFGQSRLSGVGGTRGCDWWFTEEAVILDTAGRLFTHEGGASDEAEWEAFLDQLATYRPMCPINGVMLVLPCDGLLTDSSAVRSQKANQIAGSLSTLVKRLEAQVPVYLILTKGDKVFGFAEAAHKLGSTQRQQMFGWSREASLFDAPFSVEEVREGFNGMVDQARALREMMISEARIPEAVPEVDRMFAFPSEFEDMYPAIEVYLERVFAESSLRDKLYFRGMYLTSGLQSGAPIAKVCSELLGVEGDKDGEALENLFTRQRAYFIRDLVRRRIFSERGLVRPTARRSVTAKRNAWIGYGLSVAVASVALVSSIYLAVVGQTSDQRNKYELALDFNDGYATASPVDEVVALLDKIYAATRVDGAIPGAEDKIERELSELYIQVMNERLVPALIHSSLEELRGGPDRDAATYLAEIDRYAEFVRATDRISVLMEPFAARTLEDFQAIGLDEDPDVQRVVANATELLGELELLDDEWVAPAYGERLDNTELEPYATRVAQLWDEVLDAHALHAPTHELGYVTALHGMYTTHDVLLGDSGDSWGDVEREGLGYSRSYDRMLATAKVLTPTGLATFDSLETYFLLSALGQRNKAFEANAAGLRAKDAGAGSFAEDQGSLLSFLELDMEWVAAKQSFNHTGKELFGGGGEASGDDVGPLSITRLKQARSELRGKLSSLRNGMSADARRKLRQALKDQFKAEGVPEMPGKMALVIDELLADACRPEFVRSVQEAGYVSDLGQALLRTEEFERAEDPAKRVFWMRVQGPANKYHGLTTWRSLVQEHGVSEGRVVGGILYPGLVEHLVGVRALRNSARGKQEYTSTTEAASRLLTQYLSHLLSQEGTLVVPLPPAAVESATEWSEYAAFLQALADATEWSEEANEVRRRLLRATLDAFTARWAADGGRQVGDMARELLAYVEAYDALGEDVVKAGRDSEWEEDRRLFRREVLRLVEDQTVELQNHWRAGWTSRIAETLIDQVEEWREDEHTLIEQEEAELPARAQDLRPAVEALFQGEALTEAVEDELDLWTLWSGRPIALARKNEFRATLEQLTGLSLDNGDEVSSKLIEVREAKLPEPSHGLEAAAVEVIDRLEEVLVEDLESRYLEQLHQRLFEAARGTVADALWEPPSSEKQSYVGRAVRDFFTGTFQDLRRDFSYDLLLAERMRKPHEDTRWQNWRDVDLFVGSLREFLWNEVGAQRADIEISILPDISSVTEDSLWAGIDAGEYFHPIGPNKTKSEITATEGHEEDYVLEGWEFDGDEQLKFRFVYAPTAETEERKVVLYGPLVPLQLAWSGVQDPVEPARWAVQLEGPELEDLDDTPYFVRILRDVTNDGPTTLPVRPARPTGKLER